MLTRTLILDWQGTAADWFCLPYQADIGGSGLDSWRQFGEEVSRAVPCRVRDRFLFGMVRFSVRHDSKEQTDRLRINIDLFATQLSFGG